MRSPVRGLRPFLRPPFGCARLSTANVFVLEKTFESSSVCESIQDYLLKRLSTDSAAVKLKTLRVTKCTPCYSSLI